MATSVRRVVKILNPFMESGPAKQRLRTQLAPWGPHRRKLFKFHEASHLRALGKMGLTWSDIVG